MKTKHTGPGRGPISWFIYGVVCLLVLVASGCSRSTKPSIKLKITTIPPADKGGGRELEIISGYVTGASSNQRVVLYARSGAWYVQPFVETPVTAIGADGTFSSSTHLGTE